MCRLYLKYSLTNVCWVKMRIRKDVGDKDRGEGEDNEGEGVEDEGDDGEGDDDKGGDRVIG